MINDVYYNKPLIFIGATLREKLVSHHQAVNEADSISWFWALFFNLNPGLCLCESNMEKKAWFNRWFDNGCYASVVFVIPAFRIPSHLWRSVNNCNGLIFQWRAVSEWRFYLITISWNYWVIELFNELERTNLNLLNCYFADVAAVLSRTKREISAPGDNMVIQHSAVAPTEVLLNAIQNNIIAATTLAPVTCEYHEFCVRSRLLFW